MLVCRSGFGGMGALSSKERDAGASPGAIQAVTCEAPGKHANSKPRVRLASAVEGSQEDFDPFKQTLLRYFGYANELGESFRPLLHHRWVTFSYGVAGTCKCAFLTKRNATPNCGRKARQSCKHKNAYPQEASPVH